MASSIRRSTQVTVSAALTVLLAACSAATVPNATAPPPSEVPSVLPSPIETAAGSPSPTNPISRPSAEPPADSEASYEGTGEFYAIDCRTEDPCRPEFLPEPVADEPGWPVVVSGPCRGISKTADGGAFMACEIRDGTLVHRLGGDGLPVRGWPVRLPGPTASVYDNMFTIGCGDEVSSLRLASSGAVVVAAVDGALARLYVLDQHGKPVPGWPRPFPGDAPGNDGVGGNGCRGFDVGSDGSILAWGYEGVEDDIELVADRTEFVAYERDGRTRPGWPNGSTGAASRPVFAEDGSVTYVSASAKLWRHEADGSIDDGWPYQLPTKAVPYLAPDGRTIVLAGDRGAHEAISLSRTGAVTQGWPVLLGVVQTRCLFGDTPCSGSVAPVFSGDGTLYAALNDGSVTAIDAAGDILSGWPIGLGAGVHAVSLSVVDDARLVVTSASCPANDVPCTGDETPIILVFGRGGPRVE
jgi:hypothetical protein